MYSDNIICWVYCNLIYINSETIARVTGGMKVKADRDEASPYAAMLAAQDVADKCRTVGINALHIKLRATGGTRFALYICLFYNLLNNYFVSEPKLQDQELRVL
jgi:hypothetical protein